MALEDVEPSGKPTSTENSDNFESAFLQKQLDNKYESDGEGPFLVLIERFDRENCERDSKTVSELAFGKKCSEVFKDTMNDAYDLKKPGNFKFSLKFTDTIKANSFVSEFNKAVIFEGQNWKAYIPNFRIYYTVILDVYDGDSTNEEDIIANLKSSPANAPNWSPPVLAERMSAARKQPDGSFIKTKSNKYKLYFKSRDIPHKVSLHFKIFTLEPFIQKVKRCNICQRFGHVAIHCRNKNKPVCAKCAKTGHREANCNQTDLMRCVNCIRNKLDDYFHKCSDFRCPVYKWEKNAKILMARTGKSVAECKKLLADHNGNLREIIDDLNHQANNQINLASLAKTAMKRAYSSRERNFKKAKKRNSFASASNPQNDLILPEDSDCEMDDHPEHEFPANTYDYSQQNLDSPTNSPAHFESQQSRAVNEESVVSFDKVINNDKVILNVAEIAIRNLEKMYSVNLHKEPNFNSFFNSLKDNIAGCLLKQSLTPSQTS